MRAMKIRKGRGEKVPKHVQGDKMNQIPQQGKTTDRSTDAPGGEQKASGGQRPKTSGANELSKGERGSTAF